MDRLRGIEYFVEVAVRGSISGAAAALGVSPPAVSKLLSALESHLRAKLFVRTSRGVLLTGDGEAYLSCCRSALGELERAEAALSMPRQSLRGTLVVGVPPNLGTHCIAPALPRFRQMCPQITLSLRRAYRDTDLASQGLDMLVALDWLANDDLIATRLAQTRFLICAAPGYWARHGLPNEPQDLARHSCLVYRLPELVALEQWTFEKAGQRCVVRLNPRSVCDDQSWLIADALNGGGVVRAIDLTIRPELERGELVPVLLDWETCEAPPIHLIYRAVQRRNERVRAFTSFALELFAQVEKDRLPRMNGVPIDAPKPTWWDDVRAKSPRLVASYSVIRRQ